jgi:transposase
VGLDVHKESIGVAYAREDRGAEVVALGTIGPRQCGLDKLTSPTAVEGRHAGVRLRGGAVWVRVVSVAHAEGFACHVVAPSLIPRRPGDRAVTEQQERLQRLETELHEAVKTRRLCPVVEAIQAWRGIELTGAVILIAELGDLTRVDTPRTLMAYLGLPPSEYSSGGHRRQGGITKAGNSHARRARVEGAWAYRYPAKVSRHLQLRLEKVPARSCQEVCK